MISMTVVIIVVAFLVGLILIIPTEREQRYMLRGKVLTLKQIAELLCEDGVLVTEMKDKIQMAYDHNSDAIPDVLEILAEAEIPAERFHDSIIVQRPFPQSN